MHSTPRSRFGSGATIDDVAAAAGVSIRTVSRVLNKSTKVNAETRARIEAAMAALSFKPSSRARGLATGRSYLIGLVHHDQNALVLGEVQQGVAKEAARRGYDLVVHPAPTDEEDPIGDVLDFAHRSRVDGLLVLSPVSGVEGLPQALKDAQVTACALSAVAIDGFASTSIYDEREGCAQAARHLIDLGHTRIALVSGPDVISAGERRAGFLDALAAAGLSPAGEASGDYGFESGVAGGLQLLALDPRPTAIFAVNDVMAAGVLKAAATLGLTAPKDLSVVGFDLSLLSRMLSPALTAVHRPMREIGEAATRRLIDILEGAPAEDQVATAVTLVVSESSGPAPA